MESKKRPEVTHIVLRDLWVRQRFEACTATERCSMTAVVLNALEEYLDWPEPGRVARWPALTRCRCYSSFSLKKSGSTSYR